MFMLGACGCFAFTSIFVRFATEWVHPFEAALFRNLFGLAFILILVLPQDGVRILVPQRPGMLVLRGTLNGASMLMWFYAVPLMPLADLTALGFTAPLWATVLAVVFLGEKVRLRRWTATLIGFAGTLLIIQPGFKDFHWATYLALGSSMMWGATVIVVRHMTAYERPNTILVYQAVMMSLIALGPSLWVWRPPGFEALAWMAGLGLLAATAHWCHVRAYSMQEVAALQPLDFTRLPIIAVAAWLLFAEVPGVGIWLGAAVIFGAGLYISYREAQLRSARRPH